MDNTNHNNKYIIWLYNLTAREYTILKPFFPEEHFDIIDILDDKRKFSELAEEGILNKPDLLICDENTSLDENIKNVLYNSKCGLAKVTTRKLQTYSGNTFELTNENITILEKKGDKFLQKNTTVVAESLNKITDLCQQANIAKLHEMIKHKSNKILSHIDIDKEYTEGKTFSDVSKDYLFKLAKVLNNYISLKDHYTAGHCKRVSMYTEALGIAYGLNNSELEDLILAANLHDIGKIALPDAVITKTSKLTDFEYNLMQKHVELGTNILPNNAYNRIKSSIRGHHEKLDGSGYPDGLKENEISQGAKMIAIADSFDAMTSQRSYNKVKSAYEAFDDLLAHTKSKEEGGLGYFYDPELVNLFIKTISNSKTIMDELAKQKAIADVNYERAKNLINNEDEVEKGAKRYA